MNICLRKVFEDCIILGIKSELMNVSVMWMVMLCYGGKLGYRDFCNKIVI